MSENTVTRRQRLTMPLVAWRLLGEYLVVIDYDRDTRGQSRVSCTQVASAVLARFLIEHAHEIRRATEEVRLAAVKGALSNFCTSEQLAAISSASRSDIPDVFRIGSKGQSAAERDKARRTLQRVVTRSKNTAARPAGKPRKVRRRRSKPSPGTGVK